jgi:hypothetical protein
LGEPTWTSNFAAIRFAVGKDIDAADTAALDRNGVVDIQVLANDMVEHENAAAACFPYPPGLNFRQARAWKCSALRIRNRHVLDCVSRCADRDQRGRRDGPTDPIRHGVISLRWFAALAKPSPAARTMLFTGQKKKPTPPRKVSAFAPAGSLLITF